MSVLDSVTSLLKPKESCQAVVSESDSVIETCGNPIHGKGCIEDTEFIFCVEHIPSDSRPWMDHRVGAIDFYFSESDEIISVV